MRIARREPGPTNRFPLGSLRPPADVDAEDRFLGIIPVAEWRELREEFPSMAWIMLVELWCRQYGVSMTIPNRTITDATLAGWSCRMKEFFEDVSVLAWGPRKQDSLLATATQKRLELIYKGTGAYPIFAETVELLAEFYSPAFERIPPLEVDQESFVIVGDSAPALCTPGNQRNTIRAKHTCIDRLREECARSRPYVGSTVMDMRWGKGIQLPDEGVSSSWCGAGMTSTEPTGTSASHGATRILGSRRPRR